MAERSLESMVNHLHRVAVERDATASDGELLTRFVHTHDSSAFELIVWRHGAMVQAVCRRVLGKHGEIDDAFQATFLVLLRYARSIRQRDSLAGWLHGVALRVAHRCLRSLGTRQRVERRAAKQESQVPADSDYSDVCPILDAEIARLPERLRKPFILCEIEGRTDAEVAAMLAIPYGTVVSRLSRARERLRRRLVQRGVVLGATGLASAIAVEPVSAALVSQTIREVLRSDSGSAIAGPAGSLAKGAIKVMYLRKMKVLAASLLALLILSGAGVGISRQMMAVRADDAISAKPSDSPQERTQRRTDADEPEKSKPTPVLVSPPVKRIVSDYLNISGILRPSSSVTVRPRISGTLSRVAVRDGAEVPQGALLFEIDSRASQAEVDRARANLIGAEAKLKLADSSAKRATALREKSQISQEEVEKATAARTEAEANWLQAKAVIEQAQRTLELTHVTAPIAGQIGRHLVDSGNVVKADETPLAEIINCDMMYIYCDVNERSLLQIRSLFDQGNAHNKRLSAIIGLMADSGFSREGVVDFIENKIDNAGNANVRILVPNKDKKLVPGMTARVRLIVSEPYEAFILPGSAIHLEKNGKYFVFVVSARNTLEKRFVTLGQRREYESVVKDGLKLEDRVVVDKPAQLTDGMAVEPRASASDK